jgi:hypothetical protein
MGKPRVTDAKDGRLMLDPKFTMHNANCAGNDT